MSSVEAGGDLSYVSEFCVESEYQMFLRERFTVKDCNPLYNALNSINLKAFATTNIDNIPLMVGYKCGLRLGEVFGLCWEDIDFKHRTLSVNRQVQWLTDDSRTVQEKRQTNGSLKCGNGYWYFSPPKYNSYRVIDLDDELIRLLQRTKKQQIKDKAYYAEYYYRYFTAYPLSYNGQKPIQTISKNKISQNDGNNEIHLICVRQSGEYISPRTMQHTSRIIHKKMNYPEFDFHSLRHTHATMLAENGAPVKYIQNRLGHAKIDVTLNIYQHLTKSMSQQGTIILNDMFSG